MTFNRNLCYFGDFLFVAITCERNSLFGSLAVHTLNYLCPVSVGRYIRFRTPYEIGRRISAKQWPYILILGPFIDHKNSTGYTRIAGWARSLASNSE